MEKKLVMISQPMKGLTDEEIKMARDAAIEYLEGLGYEVAITYFPEKWQELHVTGVKHIPLWFLAQSLEAMSEVDAVYFCKGWEQARGCLIEHNAAAAYGLEILYEVTK